MLKGLVSLITGGASGLGKATAERFVRQGAKVVICDVLQHREGEKIAQELGSNAVFSHCNVSSEEDVQNALGICKKHFERLNVLVNCAGIADQGLVYNVRTKAVHSLELFNKVQNVNLTGTFNTIRLATPLFAENEPNDSDGERGVIINTASIAAFESTVGMAAYAASKGAIVAMTAPIAKDLAFIGVRNVTIAPGFFHTPLYESLPAKHRAIHLSKIPFPKRLGNPDEFAKLVQDIVLNKMINGETIRLDALCRM